MTAPPQDDKRHSAAARPPQRSRAVQFHDHLAKDWASGYSRPSFARRLAVFRRLIAHHVRPGTRWLDLGCGSGVLTHELSARQAWVTAVDGSANMLHQARRQQQLGTAYPVTWLQSDIHDLRAIRDGSFDGVLCSSVIEYAEHPTAVLAEAARVLQADGALIMSLPPTRSLVRTLQKLTRRLVRVVGTDKFSYLAVSRFEIAPARMPQFFAAGGFAVERLTTFDPFVPNYLQAVFRPALFIIEARKQPICGITQDGTAGTRVCVE